VRCRTAPGIQRLMKKGNRQIINPFLMEYAVEQVLIFYLAKKKRKMFKKSLLRSRISFLPITPGYTRG
jgi:hypothetical protein